jgi:hypothetical protein
MQQEELDEHDRSIKEMNEDIKNLKKRLIGTELRMQNMHSELKQAFFQMYSHSIPHSQTEIRPRFTFGPDVLKKEE